MERIIQTISRELNLRQNHVENVIDLIDAGNTIPFIARYRKELTGTMDDQVLRLLEERLAYLRSLEKRRGEIIASIESQDKLTPELSAAVEAAATLAELEDIYRPYRPKRRTRATIARERGLEPLAVLLFAQDIRSGSLEELAAPYINPQKEIETAEAALEGASDIIADNISDSADIRGMLRRLIDSGASLVSKAAVEEDTVYRIYYDFSETLKKLQSHQILAINRGEKEGKLKVALVLNRESALKAMNDLLLKPGSISTDFVETAIADSYDRLIFPSLENETRGSLSEIAAEKAIHTFALNLEPLLMQQPVKGKVVMGFDPAYRTGCKIAVVDPTGKALETTVVYPTPPMNKTKEAAAELSGLIKKHGIQCIAIGNGTASKESEIFIAELIRDFPGLSYMMVNEAGASVYSASKLGAEEFPDFDVSLRSAVSIARRLQDPLAELVKIDPKSIGVGQYQHDMPQARLSETLTGVVENCVGRVGVDLNTASASLLARVSGLSAPVARNIVAARDENGLFANRTALKKIKGLGPKAFVQSAGFLRVPDGKNILDNTAVHPESYPAAEKLLEICGYSLKDLKNGAIGDLSERIKQTGEQKCADYCGVGPPTLRDIAAELQKPGRDMRDDLPPPMLRTDVMDIRSLLPGMKLKGTVRNVVDFGVFVDIGVHQDGLVHISQCSDRFVRHPSEVLKVGQVVDVVVLECDVSKKRISLSIKQAGREN